MAIEWNYSELAKSYSSRPQYSPTVISAIFKNISSANKLEACDIGAGTGHLTLNLAKYCKKVTAIEPNSQMLEIGKKRTRDLSHVTWKQATAENTSLPNACCELVAFGSSFNVCDRSAALAEAYRLTGKEGWFACMWNHRNLEDPLQQKIENIIKNNISGYVYGTRREDQTDFLQKSEMFSKILKLESPVDYEISITDFVTAWHSHATLQRQAKNKFSEIITEIEAYLQSLQLTKITVPYKTRAWIGLFK